MRCASHGRVLEDELTQTVSSEAGVPKVMRPRCGATVMGMVSLLGCETARRLTGAGPEEMGKNTHRGAGGYRRRPASAGGVGVV
jgi:hypothetical protein